MLKVVAHFLNGLLVKGESFDVSPVRPTCLIHTSDKGPVTVKFSELKGLFIVKDLAGMPDYEEAKSVDPADPRGRGARWLEMKFLDGETIVGLSTNYSEGLPIFAVVPTDANSNNARILVNRDAVGSVRVLPAA